MQKRELIVKNFQTPQDFEKTFAKMQLFTQKRTTEQDEIWLLEHPHVYTQGLAGKNEHILQSLPYPLVKTDRGGQVTFHGPGQIMCYLLLDLKRAQLNIIDLVDNIEKIIIMVLKSVGIPAAADKELGRGIYVNKSKIASIGIKVKRYCSYHGFALNFDCDLKPFNLINPCGYKNLEMTNLLKLQNSFTAEQIRTKIIEQCYGIFNYDQIKKISVG